MWENGLWQYLENLFSAHYAAFRCARTYGVSRETFMLNPLMAGFLLSQPHCVSLRGKPLG